MGVLLDREFRAICFGIQCHFGLFQFVFKEAFSFMEPLADRALRLFLFLEQLVVAAIAAIGRSSFAIAVLALVGLVSGFKRLVFHC
jgi:hypothetical protein